ncbi:Class I SAM-dependent methyltransferase [Sulfidibacter corallicola]|uniref:Class I SAM-dependent methyltransferase n=1 Tax=Sulfidibacter corallicola TaxID=2818388 RepID=A0A8A4TTS6_SULCO|nr:class I SAM-dependent methyltransferase [Sulfidibacter corallicola]QTD52491.1 class I SAM-dependent methyltransferase [Sulfidibacter corallicola]
MSPTEILDRYHQCSGRTSDVFPFWLHASGQCSYEMLVNRTSEAHTGDARILDLACGDGYFLNLLWEKGFHHLTGSDRSGAELEAARERLTSAVRLDRADAHRQPYDDRSFDLVTCHMALMLMKPLAPVLTEIARILKSGGRLIALVPRPLLDPVMDCYREALQTVCAETGLKPLQLGDPQLSRRNAATRLLEACGLGGEVRLEDLVVQRSGSVEALWNAMAASYDVFRLPTTARTRLRQRVSAKWRTLSSDGDSLTCRMGLRLITAVRMEGRDPSPQ